MNQTSVFCLAFSHLQAGQMVLRLRRAAFSSHDISVLSATGPMVAALGDMVCGLLSQGVPPLEARLYEDRLKEGHTLVSVHAGNDDAMMVAMEIFTKAGGSAVCATEKFFQRSCPVITTLPGPMSESRLNLA